MFLQEWCNCVLGAKKRREFSPPISQSPLKKNRPLRITRFDSPKNDLSSEGDFSQYDIDSETPTELKSVCFNSISF